MAYMPSKTLVPDEDEDGEASRDVLQVEHIGLDGDNRGFNNDLDPLHVVEAEV